MIEVLTNYIKFINEKHNTIKEDISYFKDTMNINNINVTDLKHEIDTYEQAIAIALTLIDNIILKKEYREYKKSDMKRMLINQKILKRLLSVNVDIFNNEYESILKINKFWNM